MRRTIYTTFALFLFQATLWPSLATAKPIQIVAFGDSLTAGYLIPKSKAYPAQLQETLRKRGHDIRVKNAGVNGSTTRDALRRFDLAIDPDTDICILEFGLNDLRQGVARKTLDARLTTLIETLTHRRIEVLLIGAGGLDLTSVAHKNNVPYVQWRLPPHKHRARDGAHYNAEGYRIVVGQMLPQVETLIERVQTSR